MDYKARLKAMRNDRIAGTIKRAEQERKLRHEIAMDELAAARGLHGLSDEDKCVIELATIEILTIDSIFNTLPQTKKNSMIRKAVKKAIGQIAADLKTVINAMLNEKDSETKGNYAAHRFGQKMTFSYYGESYVTIDMAERTFTVTQVPAYNTARKMIRFLAELCGLDLPDMQEAVYNFEVIHEINL